MYTANYKLLIFMVMSSLLMTGCSGTSDALGGGGTGVTENEGVVSQRNFTIAASDFQPSVLDEEGFHVLEVTITAYIGDRNNQAITGSHTVYFETEWGVIDPSCVTVDGACSVIWKTASFNTDFFWPDNDTGGYAAGSPASTIVAYTLGEESFTDLNDNNLFDDDDNLLGTALFNDFEEAYIDIGNDGAFDLGTDHVIDTINGLDSLGSNNTHDGVDSMFNGAGCIHSSLCSDVTLTMVWESLALKLDGPPVDVVP